MAEAVPVGAGLVPWAHGASVPMLPPVGLDTAIKRLDFFFFPPINVHLEALPLNCSQCSSVTGGTDSGWVENHLTAHTEHAYRLSDFE